MAEPSILESLGHNWTRDHRDPLYTFELNGEQWGFYGMSLAAWHVLLFFIFMQALYSALIFSPIVYKFIIQKQGSAISYVVCFTMIPVIFLAPYFAFQLFDIRNQIMRFCMGTIMPVTCLFKTTAATYGFTPSYAKGSLKDFALFYATPMLMQRDPKLDKFVPVSTSETLNHVKAFFFALFVTGIAQSLFNYFPGLVPPFAQGHPPEDWYHLSTLLYPQKWVVRNILFAAYFQIKIQCYAEGLIIAQGLVTGYRTGEIMDNPVMTARSVSEFWGSKWNLVIHDALKLGVYLPVRKHFPKHVAMLSTFLASGIFHEILLHEFTYPLDDKDGCFSDPAAAATKVDCYSPRPFTTTIFFLWQAAIIAMEYSPLGKLAFWKTIPTKVCALMVLVSGGAFAHYFVEPYWNSLAFENASMFFFLIRPVA